jgi:hypothetical protein
MMFHFLSTTKPQNKKQTCARTRAKRKEQGYYGSNVVAGNGMSKLLAVEPSLLSKKRGWGKKKRDH